MDFKDTCTGLTGSSWVLFHRHTDCIRAVTCIPQDRLQVATGCLCVACDALMLACCKEGELSLGVKLGSSKLVSVAQQHNTSLQRIVVFASVTTALAKLHELCKSMQRARSYSHPCASTHVLLLGLPLGVLLASQQRTSILGSLYL